MTPCIIAMARFAAFLVVFLNYWQHEHHHLDNIELRHGQLHPEKKARGESQNNNTNNAQFNIYTGIANPVSLIVSRGQT